MKYAMSLGEFFYQVKKSLLGILLWRALPLYVVSGIAFYAFYASLWGEVVTWEVYLKIQGIAVGLWLVLLYFTLPRPYAYFLRVFPHVTKDRTLKAKAAVLEERDTKDKKWSKETIRQKIESRAQKELNKHLRDPKLGTKYFARCQDDECVYQLDAYADVLTQDLKARNEDEEEKPRSKIKARRSTKDDTDGEVEVTEMPASSRMSGLFGRPVQDEEEVAEIKEKQARRKQASDENSRALKWSMPILFIVGGLALYQVVQIMAPALAGLAQILLPFIIGGAVLAWFWKSLSSSMRTVLTVVVIIGAIFIVGQLSPAQAESGGIPALASIQNALKGIFPAQEPTPNPDSNQPTVQPTPVPLVKVANTSNITLQSQVIAADTANKGKGEVISAANILVGHRLLLDVARQKIDREKMDLIDWPVLEMGNGKDSGFRQGLWLLQDWNTRGLPVSGMQDPFPKRAYAMSASNEIDAPMAGRLVNIADQTFKTDEALHSMVENLVCVHQVVKAAGMDLAKANQDQLAQCWRLAESAETLANSRIVDLNRAYNEAGIPVQIDMMTGYVQFMKDALPPNKEVEVFVTPTPEGQKDSGAKNNNPEPTLRSAAPDTQVTPTAPSNEAPAGCPSEGAKASVKDLKFLGNVNALWDIMMFMTKEPATLVENNAACGGWIVKTAEGSVGWVVVKDTYTGAQQGDRVRMVVDGKKYQLWKVDADGKNTEMMAEAGQN